MYAICCKACRAISMIIGMGFIKVARGALILKGLEMVSCVPLFLTVQGA